MIRSLVAGLVVFSLVSCGGKAKDADAGFKYKPTYGYFLTTASATLSGVLLYLTSEADIDLFETQTGTAQTAGLSLIVGNVVNAAGGAGLPGVTMLPYNDSGFSAGNTFYQSSSTGQYGGALQQTSSTGRFVVMNVSSGRVNLKCALGATGGVGADGNVYLDVKGDSVVYVTLKATPTSSTVTWAGVTQDLGGGGTAGPAATELSTNYQILGQMAAPVASSGADGSFSAGTVNARNSFLVKCTKAACVDTYTYRSTVATNLTAPSGNVFIVPTAARDLELKPTTPATPYTAGTGVIRGVVIDGAGGFTVEARDEGGNVVGEVRYGNNANSGKPDDALTSTQATPGIYYIYNVPPGQIFIRVLKTNFAATAYVDVIADSWTLPLDMTPGAVSATTISVSGSLITLLGNGVPNGTIGLQGAAVGATSDAFNNYSISSVPTGHQMIVKTAK